MARMKVVHGVQDDQVKLTEKEEVDKFITEYVTWHNKRIARIKNERPEAVHYIPGKTEVIMKNRKRNSGAG